MRRLIRTDGTSASFERPISMRRVHELLRVDTLDVVVLRHMGYPLHVMLVDDNGWESEPVEHDGWTELRAIRPRGPINAEATRLYRDHCKPGTTHQIVGDVFICPDNDFPE